MLVVEDQEPIQTLSANGPHEPFGDTVGLRRAKRRAKDRYPIALEDPVKAFGELDPDRESESGEVAGASPTSTSVAGLPRHPRPAWIRRARREMHATRAEICVAREGQEKGNISYRCGSRRLKAESQLLSCSANALIKAEKFHARNARPGR